MSEGTNPPPPTEDWYEQTFKTELAEVEATEHDRAPSPAQPAATSNSIVVPGLGIGFDLADELKELAALKESGLLSPSEFALAKQKIIKDTTAIYSRGGIYDEDSAKAPDAEWYKRQLIAIYRKYNPPKLEDVDRLLETFAGREEELLYAATRKYMDKGNKPKTLVATMMQALSPIVIEKDVESRDKEIDDDDDDDDGDDDDEKVESSEKSSSEDGVTTPPLPPAPFSAEDDEMMAQARDIQEWVRLDFENIIIKWKRQIEEQGEEKEEGGEGVVSALGGRGTYEHFLAECFGENIAFDGKGKVRWIDARVQGAEWRGVFERVHTTDALHMIGTAPGLEYQEEGTRGWYREQLVALYEKHNPPKVADVDRLLDKFHGKEKEVLEAARRKYEHQDKRGMVQREKSVRFDASAEGGAEDGAKGGAEGSEMSVRQQLIAFYVEHDPQRAPDIAAHVDHLLLNFSMEGIGTSLRAKYGAYPAGI
jgi:hypothetical protein